MHLKKWMKARPSFAICRLIEACPLATLREMPGAESNPHVRNISVSVNKPLYMECEYHVLLSKYQVNVLFGKQAYKQYLLIAGHSFLLRSCRYAISANYSVLITSLQMCSDIRLAKFPPQDPSILTLSSPRSFSLTLATLLARSC